MGALLTSIFNLANILQAHIDVPVLASFILEPMAILSAVSLTYFNHTRQPRSSNALLLFWPVFATATGIWVRTRLAIGIGRYLPVLVSKAVVVGLGLLTFGLECIGPQSDAKPQLGQNPYAENPTVGANIFSIWVCLKLFPHYVGLLPVCYFNSAVLQLDDTTDEKGCQTIHHRTRSSGVNPF